MQHNSCIKRVSTAKVADWDPYRTFSNGINYRFNIYLIDKGYQWQYCHIRNMYYNMWWKIIKYLKNTLNHYTFWNLNTLVLCKQQRIRADHCRTAPLALFSTTHALAWNIKGGSLSEYATLKIKIMCYLVIRSCIQLIQFAFLKNWSQKKLWYE